MNRTVTATKVSATGIMSRVESGTGSRIDIAFARLLVLLDCALFLLMHALVTKL
jgi:hypothetical protein